MNDDVTHMTEPSTTVPRLAEGKQDPIAQGVYSDLDANLRVVLLSGRTLNGQHVAEEHHGVTLSIDGWEYTLPWSQIQYAVSLPVQS